MTLTVLTHIQGGLGLETIAVCHEKHLVQYVPETTAESGIRDTMKNKH